jgi:GntR family transcriptional regulator
MKLIRGPLPLYHQLAQILRSQINAQEYKPKDMLPTEDELIRTFGISRSTVRQALQALLNERLIVRVAGRGTFVADERTPQQRDWSIESLEGIANSGYETQLKFLGQARVPASDGMAQSLGVPPGTEVVRIRKLELVNGKPFFHITLYLPSDIGGKIPVDLIEQRPVFLLIEEYCGCEIAEARQWVDASLASAEVARHLKLRPGDPLLLVERHFLDTTGRVVEVAIDHYRTDRMRHFMRLRRATSPSGI